MEQYQHLVKAVASSTGSINYASVTPNESLASSCDVLHLRLYHIRDSYEDGYDELQSLRLRWYSRTKWNAT